MNIFEYSLTTGGSIRLTGRWGDVVENSFLRRAAHFYNEIPNEIRKSNTQDIFKKKLEPAFYDDSKIPNVKLYTKGNKLYFTLEEEAKR